MGMFSTVDRRASAPAWPLTSSRRLPACVIIIGLGWLGHPGVAAAAEPTVSHVVSGSWQSTDFRSPSNPGCSMGGAGPVTGSRLIMGASRLHPNPMSLVVRKTSWAIPLGTRVDVLATFPDGSSLHLPGTGSGNTIDILLGADQLALWVHGLTASSGMQLTFGGSEPPWTFDLTGTTKVVNAMGDCFRSHQITGVGAPFALGLGTPDAPGEATQPFAAPSTSPMLPIPLATVAPTRLQAPTPTPAVVPPPFRQPQASPSTSPVYSASPTRNLPAAAATEPPPFDTSTSASTLRPLMAAVAAPNSVGGLPVRQSAIAAPGSYEPVMDVFVEDPARPVFHGRTNLPDGAELMLTLTRPASGFMAQAKMNVVSGQFVTERMSQGGSPLNPGRYKLEVSMSLALLQPAAVRAMVGEHGERMSGSLVTASQFDPGEHLFDFVETVELGGPADGALDAAAKARSVADLRDWMAMGCTSNLDFVNAMVRSGAVTGTEILGEERRRRVEACVADAKTRPMP